MKLDSVSISYDKQTVIDSLDLELVAGEIFVLMGPSGSGKSTLLKGIAGLLPFSSGELSWGNLIGTTGLVFQEPRLFPHLTVLENLAFGLRAKGVPKKERFRQVQQFLDILQLQGLENRYPHQLSGGQQQRVSLGRVLVLKPDLLLLDEPFASLDTPLRIQLTEWLYQLQREQGFSVLWVTHYIDEAFSVANRVGLILNGKIQQIGLPVDFYQKPRSETVASFFALPNRFSVDQWHGMIQGGMNRVAVGKNGMGWVPTNALQLNDQTDTHHDDQSTVFINGVVNRVKHEKNGNIVCVEVDEGLLQVELNLWGQVPELGKQVQVGVPTSRIIWYPRDII